MYDYDISIIIVNYNVRDYLYKCLKSIEEASQNLRVETIVVDNNSDDNSVEYLKPHFPKVQFIASKENLGFGRANNLGFTYAKGKYYLILNPDTILQENTLTTMYNYMEEHKEVGVSICKVLNADGSFQAACKRGFPTPWASFTKLFGLQALFPKSKLFGRYNQAYMPTDETQYVEAVIGAFMFVHRDVINEVGGFDPDFFMYGEDLDLCYRIHKAGYKNAYVHTTSIIHYKGESSKRSSMDNIKIFYEAMEIFARKHYANSNLFLLFMKLGIKLRTFIAYLSKYKRDILLVTIDSIFLIFSLLLGTYIVFGRFLGFPDYAYPTVFIVILSISFINMVLVGEYFEDSGSIAKTVFGNTISFMALSTLTYFFPAYRFSRGALLVTIGLTIILSVTFRIILNVLFKAGKGESVRAIFIGSPSTFQQLLDDFRKSNPLDIFLAGFVNDDSNESDVAIPWLGRKNHLNEIIKEHKINNVIITDPKMSSEQIMRIISIPSNKKAKFHLAHKYEDFIASQLINNITFSQKSLPRYNIHLLRFRIYKRILDILVSFLLIISIIPLFILSKRGIKFSDLMKVFIGKYSLIGIKEINNDSLGMKQGLITLADLSSIGTVPAESINELNEYYLKNYSISLDLEILIKFMLKSE